MVDFYWPSLCKSQPKKMFGTILWFKIQVLYIMFYKPSSFISQNDHAFFSSAICLSLSGSAILLRRRFWGAGFPEDCCGVFAGGSELLPRAGVATFRGVLHGFSPWGTGVDDFISETDLLFLPFKLFWTSSSGASGMDIFFKRGRPGTSKFSEMDCEGMPPRFCLGFSCSLG